MANALVAVIIISMQTCTSTALFQASGCLHVPQYVPATRGAKVEVASLTPLANQLAYLRFTHCELL
jgi:hypothetical protein